MVSIGHMAIACTNDLELTVEKSAKSLISSAVSGEGLVNVYRLCVCTVIE